MIIPDPLVHHFPGVFAKFFPGRPMLYSEERNSYFQKPNAKDRNSTYSYYNYNGQHTEVLFFLRAKIKPTPCHLYNLPVIQVTFFKNVISFNLLIQKN
jgi:hypothetical protein